MNYEFMRMLLFFDLPVKTKKDRRTYSLFRKALIKKTSYDLINNIIGEKIVLFEKSEIKELNDFLFLENKIIDLDDDNYIFELCNNYIKNVNLKEMKQQLIMEYFNQRVI